LLSQIHRLRKRQDFALTYQYGKRWRGRHFLVRTYRQRCFPMSPLPSTRIGIVVSQKVSKRAVKRNQIKRRLRAACRELWPNILPGWDVVITVQTSGAANPTPVGKGVKRPLARSRDFPHPPLAVLGCTYKDFLQELKELLAEAKVLDGH
jgi:ribonuclease P protein component